MNDAHLHALCSDLKLCQEISNFPTSTDISDIAVIYNLTRKLLAVCLHNIINIE